MAEQTTNLHLKKPAYGESADVADLNDNMDTIDTVVKQAQDDIDAIETWQPENDGTLDQILRSNGDGTTRWDDVPSDETFATMVGDWLDANIDQAETAAIDDTLLVPHAAAESKTVGEKIAELKNAVDTTATARSVVVLNTTTWSQGGYNSSDGSASNNTKRIRLSLFSLDTNTGIHVVVPSGLKLLVFIYENDTNNTYVGYKTWQTGDVYEYGDNKKYKIVAAYTDDTQLIDPSEGDNIQVYAIGNTDKTLSEVGKAADAEVVGRLGLLYRRQLSNGEYLEDIKDNGAYVRVNRTSVIIPDSPTTNKFVMFNAGNPANTGIKASLLISSKNDVFIRFKDLGSEEPFNAWLQLANKNDITENVGYLKSAVQSLYKNQLTIYGNLIKGARTTTGGITSSVGITTIEPFELDVGTKIDVKVATGWAYTVVEGNTMSRFKYTHRTTRDESFTTVRKYVFLNIYKMEDDTAVETAVSDFTDQIIMTIASTEEDAIDLSDYTREKPENVGVSNVIRRAYQCVKLGFEALADIPHWGSSGKIAEGQSFVGVPYSSVRPENLYVPQCVSIHAFMTALQNPNSYIYTREQAIPGYSGHCYMGSVCSAFVSWCYNITKTIPTTRAYYEQYQELGFVRLDNADQNWEHIKLGDMINKQDVHILIVTDILKNRFGDITYIELSEATNNGNACARSTVYYRTKITSLINSGYRIYRYTNIADIPYTASPWVRVDDSEKPDPDFNDVIIPRRGDRANWHEGEDVVIDIMSPAGYTGYELVEYLEGTTETGELSGTVITLSGLSSGAYKLRLTGDSNSDWVYFDVKRTQGTSYEVLANRKIKVTPYIDHGEWGSVVFCCNNPSNGGDNLAVRSFHVFTEEEKAQGYAIVDPPPANEYYAVNDVWYMRCMYPTGNFGLYSGQLTLVNVLGVGQTFVESAYQRNQYIVDYEG